MPTARIVVAKESQYSAELARDLRSRGFDSVTIAREGDGGDAVDLEVVLRECRAELASDIAGLPSGRDIRVFATPAALRGSARSVEVFVVQPRAEAELAEPAERIIFESMAPAREKEPEQAESKAGAEFDPVALQEQQQGAPPVTANNETSPALQTAPTYDFDPELVPHGMIWQASSSEELNRPQEPVPLAGSFVEGGLPASEKPAGKKANRNPGRFWNTAALAGAVAVVVLGALLFARHVSPLPRAYKTVTPAVQQTLPFQAPTPIAQSSNQPATVELDSSAPGVRQASMSVRTSQGARRNPPRNQFQESGYVAQDRVVNIEPLPKRPQPRNSAVRHISDLN